MISINNDIIKKYFLYIILWYTLAIIIDNNANRIPNKAISDIFIGWYWLTYDPIPIPRNREFKNL